ncbi:MAG TPA: hypothetical protein VF892_08565 [Pseudonocardiaceae bacterium]
MELAIMFVSLLALLAIENFVTRRSDRYRTELVHAVMPTAPTAQAAPRGELSFDGAERALSRQVVAGQVDRADYRDAMAALAATDQCRTGFHPLRTMAIGNESRDQIAQLRAAMPTMAPATVFAAVALAHDGATVENLMRLLGMTNADALRVVVTASTDNHRPG